MISVAMTTYNGEKYVLKQLASIYNQTRRVDEVIICDDCSKDDTVLIITNYIKNNNIKNCKLYINDERLGFIQNFWNCISLTTGDIVFLSDQDDIWETTKVERLASLLMKNSNIKSIFAEMRYIDAHDSYIKYNNHHGNGIIPTIKHLFDKKYYNIDYKEFIKTGGYQGASIAFKKEIFDVIKHFDVRGKFAHDVLINFYASILNGFYVTKEKLTRYRLHSSNTLGIPLYRRRDRVDVLLESIKICNELKELTTYCKCKDTSIDFENINNYIDSLINVYKLRVDNLRGKNLLGQLVLFRYIGFFSSLKTFIGDIRDILF